MERFTLVLNLIVKSDNAIEGTQVGPFVVGPANNWIARAPKGMSANKLITITNTGSKPVKITSISNSEKVVRASLSVLEEGKKYSVALMSIPELALGAHKDILKVKTDSSEVPELEIEIEVNVDPAVMTTPASIVFEDIPVSDPESDISTSELYLWLRLVRGKGLEIKSMSSDLPFVKAKINAMDGRTIILKVGFKEKPPVGRHTGKLTILTNIDATDKIEVPITVVAK